MALYVIKSLGISHGTPFRFRLAHSPTLLTSLHEPEAETELMCTALTVFPIEHGRIYGSPIFGLQFSQAMKNFLLHTSRRSEMTENFTSAE